MPNNSILTPRFWAIVPAAGVGARMQASCPKQYLPLEGKTVLEHTLSKLAVPPVEAIYLALSDGDEYVQGIALDQFSVPVVRVAGGEERGDSVLSGLLALQEVATADDWVLVHDAARPGLSEVALQRLINALVADDVGGLLAMPITDTLKHANQEEHSTTVSTTVDRNHYWAAQTPQMFRYGVLLQAMQHCQTHRLVVTDEASAVEQWQDPPLQPQLIEGEAANFKITRPGDLELAEWFLQQQP